MTDSEKKKQPAAELTHQDVLQVVQNSHSPIVTAGELINTFDVGESRILSCLLELVKAGELHCQTVHSQVVWYLSD
jgi:hypothetical protein